MPDTSRKYPHSLTLVPGTTFPTGWLSTNSVHYVKCPKCGAEPEFLCVTPSGRRGQGLTGGAHGARISQFAQEFPELAKLSTVFLRRTTEKVIEEMFSEVLGESVKVTIDE